MALAQVPAVLDRLHELRAMFGVGQRATALVEELITFLHEVLPLMEEIDGSLRESTDHMPRASQQLQNVTEATEMATTEILDLVDAVLANLNAASTHLATAATPSEEGEPTPAARLRTLLRERLTDADLLAEAERLLDEDAARGGARIEAATAGSEQLKEARDSMNRILISLQVQDITAQQLASVNHLIESIRSRLSQLLSRLANDPSVHDDGVSIDPETFNPDARYDRSGAQQAVADAVTASADDIDALFGASGAAEPSGQAASADDIDALFGG